MCGQLDRSFKIITPSFNHGVVRKLFNLESADTLSDQESDTYHTPQVMSLNNSFEMSDQHHCNGDNSSTKIKEVDDRSAITNALTQAIKGAADQVVSTAKAARVEDTAMASPKVVSLEHVMAMFEKLQLQVSDVSAAKATNLNVDEVNDAFLQQDQRIDKLIGQVDYYKQKATAMVTVIDGLHMTIGDLAQRLENIEVNQAKSAITITGISLDRSRKTDNIYEIQGFLFDRLGVEAQVEDVYPIGGPNTKTCVVSLQSATEKRLIMSRREWLKGTSYYVNDYLPTTVNEKRRRERDIIKQNKQAETPLNIEYVRGNIVIQGQPYRKKIDVPTPRQMIDLSASKIGEIMKQRIDQGQPISNKGNRFIGFSTAAASFQVIRELYIKMKLVNPGARHIVCAYWINDQQPQYAMDYQDDGEFGAGRILLNWMKENDLQNRVFFVARFYASKLDGERFQGYVDAAKSVIEHAPINYLTKKDQSPTHRTQRKQYQASPNPATEHNSPKIARSYNPTRQLQKSSFSRGSSYGGDRSRGNSRGSGRGTRRGSSSSRGRMQQNLNNARYQYRNHRSGRYASNSTRSPPHKQRIQSQRNENHYGYHFSDPQTIAFDEMDDKDAQYESWSNEENGQWESDSQQNERLDIE